MRVPAFAFALGLGLSSLAAHAFVPAATPAASEQDVPPAAPKSDCLACHSYDDVIAGTAAHVTRSGEKVNPHRYVEAGSAKEHFGQPHQATGTEHIPECSNCHAPHPIPPTGAIDRSKINVEWCYSSCHHQSDFTRCGTCHN